MVREAARLCGLVSVSGSGGHLTTVTPLSARSLLRSLGSATVHLTTLAGMLTSSSLWVALGRLRYLVPPSSGRRAAVRPGLHPRTHFCFAPPPTPYPLLSLTGPPADVSLLGPPGRACVLSRGPFAELCCSNQPDFKGNFSWHHFSNVKK